MALAGQPASEQITPAMLKVLASGKWVGPGFDSQGSVTLFHRSETRKFLGEMNIERAAEPLLWRWWWSFPKCKKSVMALCLLNAILGISSHGGKFSCSWCNGPSKLENIRASTPVARLPGCRCQVLLDERLGQCDQALLDFSWARPAGVWSASYPWAP